MPTKLRTTQPPMAQRTGRREAAPLYSSVRDGVTAPELFHALGIGGEAARNALQGAFAPPWEWRRRR